MGWQSTIQPERELAAWTPWPSSYRIKMDDAEMKKIAAFLIDVHEGLCESDGEATLHLHLTKLYRVIRRLMDATFKTQNQNLKALLAMMEKKARTCKEEIEKRLGLRN